MFLRAECVESIIRHFAKTDFFISAYWTGWRRLAAWIVSLSAIFLLGVLRTATDAEFAFASLVLLPVLLIAWTAGKKSGLLIALIAAAMWAISDLAGERQFSTSWILWANAVTRFMTYSLVALLADQVRQLLEREHEHATRDALTGLLNRRAFLLDGSSEVDRSKRYAHSLAVIFLDLDNFKQLNDTKGHDAGDAALRASANAIFGSVRSSDRVARLGGDEFAVLLAEIEYDAAIDAARKISVALSDALRDFPPVNASIGLAWFETIDRLFPEMLTAADELMYEVKQTGKNNICAQRFGAISAAATER